METLLRLISADVPRVPSSYIKATRRSFRSLVGETGQRESVAELDLRWFYISQLAASLTQTHLKWLSCFFVLFL